MARVAALVRFCLFLFTWLLLHTGVAVADKLAYAVDSSDQIYDGNANIVGQLIGTPPNASAVSLIEPIGVPLSQPPFNYTHLVIHGSDGREYRYRLLPNGTLQLESVTGEDDDDGSAGMIGILGGGQGGNSGNSGGGGGAGGGGNGGSGGGGNGSTPPQPPQPPPNTPPNVDLAGIPDGFNGDVLCARANELFPDLPCTGGGAASGRGTGAKGDMRTGRDIKGSVSAEGDGAGGGRSNNIIDSFEGWSQMYGGVEKSPVTLDLRPIREVYPNLVFAEQDSKRPQMAKVYEHRQEGKVPTENIGTDDEVLKSAMTIYQPISRLQKDFLEDKTARDRYLESALTLRGVAIMTMGFLDKTVGAGLTAVQQQADQNTVQQLLKQVAWASSKLANPERAQVYRDTDEKVEACLEIALTKRAAKKQVRDTTRKIVEFECSPLCGEAPDQSAKLPYRDTSGKGKEGNGSYAYCVCCAETKIQPNKLLEDGKAGGDDERKWSLVERVFKGTKELKSGDNNEKERIEKGIRGFKEMYGDVVMQMHGQETQGSSEEPWLQFVYQFPKYSVQRRIAALRNGCHYCEGGNCKISDQGTACPLQELGLEKGICPSIAFLLKHWEEINRRDNPRRDSEVIKAWLEASLGRMLDGRIIQNLLVLNGSDPAKIEEPDGKTKRFLDAWCDASAIAAFTRYHVRLSAAMADHLALNRQITDRDKALLSSLLSRVSEELSLSQADENANYTVEAALSGLSIEADRQKASVMSAAVAANIQGQNNASSRSGEVSSFGAIAQLFNGAGAAAGGGGSGAGRAAGDPIDSMVSNLQ